MSGFVPSLVALGQGVSGNPDCVNGTQADVSVEARFTTSTFFLILFVIMVLSLTAFLLLHYLPLTRTERSSASPTSSTFNNILQDPGTEETEETEEAEERLSLRSEQQVDIRPLLVVQGLVCCLSNGALPSIQSYSCLPYGNTVYHLAVTT